MKDCWRSNEKRLVIITESAYSVGCHETMLSLCPNHYHCMVVWADATGGKELEYLAGLLSQGKRVSVGVITGITSDTDSSQDQVCHLELLRVKEGRVHCVDGRGRVYDYSVDCVAEYEVEGDEGDEGEGESDDGDGDE